MTENKNYGLFVREETDGRITKQLIDYDGSVLFEETISPHEDLLRLMERPFNEYFDTLNKLRLHHLFEEGQYGTDKEFEYVRKTAQKLCDGLKEDYPEAYFFTYEALLDRKQSNHDPLVSKRQNVGAAILEAAALPYITYNRMRNVMEVCFGDAEGTPQERYARLLAYPIFREMSLSFRWRCIDDRWVQVYCFDSLLELCFFEVCAVLRSGKLIQRCPNCLHYFVPETKRETVYCNRVQPNKKTCKQIGPKLMSRSRAEGDKYLRAYARLYARFYERQYIDYGNAEHKFTFFDWSEMAQAAREEYLDGKISGDELIARINPNNEPLGSDNKDGGHDPAGFISNTWRRLVRGSIDFDPNLYFADMVFYNIDPNDPGKEQKWQLVTEDEMRRTVRGDEMGLMERYQKPTAE